MRERISPVTDSLDSHVGNVAQKDSRKIYPAKTPTKQNPKSEYRKKPRGPKQTPRQINLKLGKSKTPKPTEVCLEFILFWSFEIVSNFGPRGRFRASNFFYLAPLREIRFPDLFFIRTFQISLVRDSTEKPLQQTLCFRHERLVRSTPLIPVRWHVLRTGFSGSISHWQPPS